MYNARTMETELRLREYKTNKARLQVIGAQIREMANEPEREYIEGEILRPLAADEVCARTTYTRGSSTERVALSTDRLNAETRAKIEELKREAHRLSCEVRQIEGALYGLYERERFVVEKFYMEGLTWYIVQVRYEEAYRMPISESALRRAKRQALKRLEGILSAG